MPARSEFPFFIVGAARSGTTLLRLMLNRHPRLAIPAESHFLTPLLERLPADSPLTPTQIQEAIRTIVECPRFGTWTLSAGRLRHAVIRQSPRTLRDVVRVAFEEETARTGKPRWGDKTPEYVTEMIPLSRLIPEARFIHLIRDGRDVSASMRHVRWHGWSEFQRARRWAGEVDSAVRAGAELGEPRYLAVNYEDLVLDTRPTLERVCTFLGEAFVPEMLTFHEDAMEHIAGFEREAGIHDKLTRAPTPDDVGRWRRESSWLRILLFEASAGRMLDRLGRERRFAGPGRPLVALAGIVYLPLGAGLNLAYVGYHHLPEWLKRLVRGSRYAGPLRDLLRAC